MKIKSIAAICKKNKNIAIFDCAPAIGEAIVKLVKATA